MCSAAWDGQGYRGYIAAEELEFISQEKLGSDVYFVITVKDPSKET